MYINQIKGGVKMAKKVEAIKSVVAVNQDIMAAIEVGKISKALPALEKKVNELKVKNEETEIAANRLLKDVKSNYNLIEADRKEMLEPVKAITKYINDSAKKLTVPLKGFEQYLKNALIAYHNKLEQKRLKEEKAKADKEKELEAQLKKADSAEAVKIERKLDRLDSKQLTSVRDTTRVGGATTSYKMVWVFQVEDISKVPAEFLNINNVAVNKKIAAGERKIKGIKIYQEKRLAIR